MMTVLNLTRVVAPMKRKGQSDAVCLCALQLLQVWVWCEGCSSLLPRKRKKQQQQQQQQSKPACAHQKILPLPLSLLTGLLCKANEHSGASQSSSLFFSSLERVILLSVIVTSELRLSVPCGRCPLWKRMILLLMLPRRQMMAVVLLLGTWMKRQELACSLLVIHHLLLLSDFLGPLVPCMKRELMCSLLRQHARFRAQRILVCQPGVSSLCTETSVEVVPPAPTCVQTLQCPDVF